MSIEQLSREARKGGGQVCVMMPRVLRAPCTTPNVSTLPVHLTGIDGEMRRLLGEGGGMMAQLAY